jgi:hypothetical protein
MKSGYPSEETVISDLGDKVTSGLAVMVAQTRSDLSVYRRTFPGWVAGSTDRGLLNWCHDRSWAHLQRIFEGVADVSFVDSPPLREMYVGTRYRMRMKKHDVEDRVSTYQTQGALAFLEQEIQGALDGLEEVRLIAGYRWDNELRQIGEPVISLRDGTEVIWAHVLAEPDGALVSETIPIAPPSGPRAPTIDMPGLEARPEATPGADEP